MGADEASDVKAPMSPIEVFTKAVSSYLNQENIKEEDILSESYTKDEEIKGEESLRRRK